MLVEENQLLAFDCTKLKLLRHNFRDNGVFCLRERNLVLGNEKFEIMVFEITGLICLFNYAG